MNQVARLPEWTVESSYLMLRYLESICHLQLRSGLFADQTLRPYHRASTSGIAGVGNLTLPAVGHNAKNGLMLLVANHSSRVGGWHPDSARVPRAAVRFRAPPLAHP